MTFGISIIRGKGEVIRERVVAPETLNEAALSDWSPFHFQNSSAQCWDAGKRGPCPFPGRHRHGSHFSSTELLAFDIDNDVEDRHGKQVRAVTFKEVETQLREAGLAFAMHSTRSHLKEKRTGDRVKAAVERFRVVLFCAEPITDPEIYSHMWLVMRDSLGLPVDEQCKDTARFYFPRGTGENVCSTFGSGDYLHIERPHPPDNSPPQIGHIDLSGWTIEERAERARAYAEKCEPAVEGQHGNEKTVLTIRRVCHDFGIDDIDTCIAVLHDWNQRCRPPWEGLEWRKKIANSLRGCKNSLGWRLGEDLVTTTAGESYPVLWKDQNGKVIWPEEAILKLLVPRLEARFAFWRDPNGSSIVYEVSSDNEASVIATPEPIAAFLTQEVQRIYGYVLSRGVVDRAIDLWKRSSKPLAREPGLVELGPGPHPVFRRLSFELEDGPTPAWDQFLGRLSSPEVFLAWWWSIFEPEQEGRQYLWLLGDGQDGKTVVASILCELFKGKVGSLASARKEFLLSAIYGRPITIYPDCKDTKFPMRAEVRYITSGDVVPIEFKGQTPFSAVVRTRLLIHSNEEPEITGGRADTSRLILIDVTESKTKSDPTWKWQLFGELPRFLYRAREEYRRRCANHGDIDLPAHHD